MADKLKPCPFCGCSITQLAFETTQGAKWGNAICPECECRGPEVRTRYAETSWHEAAIVEWNIRPDEEPIRYDSKTTVELFYLEGDDGPFVCAVNGHITKEAIEEIEQDIKDNGMDGFDKGDGSYIFEAVWQEGQYGFEGRCEIAPYIELEFLDHKPIPTWPEDE